MNISQWLTEAGKYLAERRPGAGRTDAEAILEHLTGKNRTSLYRDGEDEMPPGLEKPALDLVERRAGGEPLAYITGHKEFMGLDFYVSQAVLIPRPETELLVEKAADILKNFYPTTANRPVVADIGAGSGAIAVTLAVLLNLPMVYATDISPEALNVARRNAAGNGVGERIDFRQGDLLSPLTEIPGFRADLLTANLPYVPSREIPLLMTDVRDHEPHLALNGGEDGLDLYRRLIPVAFHTLHKGGYLLMEIGPGQEAALRGMLRAGWRVEILRDLAGRERVVSAQRAGIL
ncbi:MAG: hypothetical protein VR68_16470 [Peptococcaceae bacterium BRH_c4a]|nr:MAG: hypothetical protein VR68_16470 [Peptococcaceae bacterium BRH_c4a]